MAIVRCSECIADISDKAKSCPYCGAPVVQSRLKQAGQSILGLALIGGMIFGVVKCTQAITPEPPAQVKECRANFTKCLDNQQFVKESPIWMMVKSECQRVADARAKYGSPIWPWQPFETYRTGKSYVATGKVIAIEPDAQFENGFGGKVHSTVTCTYDVWSRSVTDLQVLPH